MQIAPLRQYPGAIPTLARWHFVEWGHLYPGQTEADFAAELKRSLAGGPVPSTWVLADGRGVWGSASIIEQDMSIHTDKGPWLASVYLHPDIRGMRLGSMLILHVQEQAAAMGLHELFLFTPGQERFYRNLGWQPVCAEHYQGEPVTIMRWSARPSERPALSA